MVSGERRSLRSPSMAELTNAAVERLLLMMSNYGRMVSRAMLEVSPDPELVTNASLVVLCTLDLDGPRRPGVLQELTGLSSGGVGKLLGRVEGAGGGGRADGRGAGRQPGRARVDHAARAGAHRPLHGRRRRAAARGARARQGDRRAAGGVDRAP